MRHGRDRGFSIAAAEQDQGDACLFRCFCVDLAVADIDPSEPLPKSPAPLLFELLPENRTVT